MMGREAWFLKRLGRMGKGREMKRMRRMGEVRKMKRVCRMVVVFI
jgi:hypothetical protein